MQDLLPNDPADHVPLRAVMNYFRHPVLRCHLNDTLDVMLEHFRKGCHMAFVYTNKTDLNVDEKINEAVGILTMENLIEELVQSDILDEADTKRERRKKRSRNKNPIH